MRTITSTAAHLLVLGRALLDLVLPLECAGCHRAGRRWCTRCGSALSMLAFCRDGGDATGPAAVAHASGAHASGAHASGAHASGATGPADPGPVGRRGARLAAPRPPPPDPGLGGRGARLVVPRPPPRGLPPVYAWGVYADPLRSAVAAWKDGGRRDLEQLLAPLMGAAVAGAVGASGWPAGPVLVVPAPSSRRSVRARGDVPLEGLCCAALCALPDTPSAGCEWTLRVSPALVHVRAVRDQAGLDTSGRRANLTGAMTVKPLWRNVVRGRRCLVVDDVVTTGATLAEAARALRAAGAREVVGATMAATQLTRG